MVASEPNVKETQGDLEIVGEVVYDDLDTLKKNATSSHAQIEARKQALLEDFKRTKTISKLTYEKLKARGDSKPTKLGKEPWEIWRGQGQLQLLVGAGVMPHDNPAGERRPQRSSGADSCSSKPASSPIASVPEPTIQSSDPLSSDQMSGRADEDTDGRSLSRTTPPSGPSESTSSRPSSVTPPSEDSPALDEAEGNEAEDNEAGALHRPKRRKVTETSA